MNPLSTQSDLTRSETIICSAMSGLITRFVIAPIDMVKIRMQLGGFNQRGVAWTAINVAKTEGLRAFWKGNAPAELLYLMYSVAQFSTLHAVNGALRDWPIGEQTKQLVSGSAAGGVATLVSYPLDFLRTRTAANTGPKSSLLSTIRSVWHQYGPVGFYHGMGATIASAIPSMGIFFSVYSFVRDKTADAGTSYWISQLLTASTAASIASKVAVYPMDTIRKHVQVHGHRTIEEVALAGYGTRYSHNFLKCGQQIVARHGFLGLYHGLTIGLVKAWPVSFLYIYFYELSVSLIRS